MLTQCPMLAELLTLELMVIINICSSTQFWVSLKFPHWPFVCDVTSERHYPKCEQTNQSIDNFEIHCHLVICGIKLWGRSVTFKTMKLINLDKDLRKILPFEILVNPRHPNPSMFLLVYSKVYINFWLCRHPHFKERLATKPTYSSVSLEQVSLVSL